MTILSNFNLQEKLSKEIENRSIEIISQQKQNFSFYAPESGNVDNIQS